MDHISITSFDIYIIIVLCLNLMAVPQSKAIKIS